MMTNAAIITAPLLQGRWPALLQPLLALAVVLAILFAGISTAQAATPIVSSVAVPADGIYTTGQALIFTVNYDQAVIVDTSGGTPAIALTVGATARYATYISGSGTSALTFRYTAIAGDTDFNGITIGMLGFNGGSINNGSETANLVLNNVGSTANVLVAAASPPAPVPTLTEWTMILLTGLLALFGAARLGFLPAARKD